MQSLRIFFLWFFIASCCSAFFLSCAAGDDDDTDNPPADDDSGDDDAPDDDTGDDDVLDDDSGDDDTDDDSADDDSADDDSADDDSADDDSADDDSADDDSGDDDTSSDTYVAPWPQSVVEPRDYDETPIPGLMRQKAAEYDTWHKEWHQPFYGSTVETYFTDETRTEVLFYGGAGDSCIWTGTYLSSQAFRYWVSGDAEAGENAIRSAEALDGHLHITGRPGFIARYRGPQDARVMPWDCATQENCHIVTSGEYAGDFWEGNTSRDQYTGWFMGMCLAYDLIDDEDLREMIKGDLAEVLDELIASNWWIIDVDGIPTTAGPNILPTMQLNWSLIGYHVTGEERFKEQVEKWIQNSRRTILRLGNITFLNHYTEYYGNNLGHENFYNLLRLAKAYLNEDDLGFLRELFDTQQHTFTRLSHNAFFNAIHMSQGIYSPTDEDPYQAQLEQDLSEFRPAPNYEYAVTPYPAELDPVSVWLDALFEQLPFLEELLGDVEPQALEAYPVFYQCSTDFLWQRNPFQLECSNPETPQHVNPGVDYLVAYWMASYHKFIFKDM